ncbi:MAG: ABC transporter permease subunit [Clostridiales bacterium]|jgi:ABC-2 type transport system permease protein|nr:ABC transporter permease subunit [Clostridiales bacterium]
MTVLKHEMRSGIGAALVWSVALSIFGVIALAMYPLVANYSDMINYLVERMGLMGQIFNLQDLNFYDFMTYYGLEYGNFMGLGGGMFAAVTGMVMVAREEGRHTAEYLYSQPVGRASVLVQKFFALVLMVTILNLFCALVSLAGISFMNQAFDRDAFTWFHLSQLMMNLQVAVLCFGISCFKKRDNVVPGLGIVLAFYFLNLFINVNRQTDVLEYLTPYFYTDISRITASGGPLWRSIGLGFASSGAVFLAGFGCYLRKDLAI